MTIKTKRYCRLKETIVPATEATGFMQLALFDRAAFLSGKPPVHRLSIVGFETIGFGRDLREYVGSLETDTIQTTATIDATSLARMIAKIGYSFAIAECGLFPRNECPVLPFILGSADDGGMWVGSTEYSLEIEKKRPSFALALIELTGVVDGAEEKVTVARVKLFASAGATGYEVVVRRSPASTVES